MNGRQDVRDKRLYDHNCSLKMLGLPDAEMEASEYHKISLLKEEKLRKIYYDHLESARVYDSDDDEEEHEEEDDASDDETRDEDSSDNETKDEKQEHHIAGDQAQVHQQVAGQQERTKRGPIDMKKFWVKHGPNNKVQLQFNHLGQPCGVKTSKLSNFMSSLAYFNLTKANNYWVMKSAAKKWRSFKYYLKITFYDATLTLKQNIANGCGNRIHEKQWEKLCKYWRKEKTMAMSAANKATRANQDNARHTAGTRSFVVVHEQEVGFLVPEIKQGQPVSRSELYRIVHTNKDGLPVDDYSAAKIEEITSAFNVNPSLIHEEHREGDLYSHIFPNPSKSRMHGFGLVVGGKSSELLNEAIAAFRDSKEENLQLRGLVETLVASQAALTERSKLIEDKLNSFLATQELKSTSTAEEEADSANKMLPETEQVSATEGAAAAKKRYNQAAEASKDEAIQGGKHLRQKDEASRGAKHLKQAAKASQGGNFWKKTEEASQLLGKHSFLATQDLKSTSTGAEEADSDKKMLPETEQVPATEGAAAAKRRRYSQAAESSKDEAIQGGKHLRQTDEASQGGKYSKKTDEASRGAKHLKQAAQATQGGKYLKQTEEASQLKQTVKESTEIAIAGIREKGNKTYRNKRRELEAEGATELIEPSQVKGTTASSQYIEASKATTLAKKKKRSAADCFKTTTTDCLKITAEAYTQVDETSQETTVVPKTKKLQNIIDSQVGELQCVVATNCTKPKPETSYKKLLEGCDELIKVKEEKVEEIIATKKHKAWFPPRKAMKVSLRY
ncbi:hypothetical protein ACQ4PT_025883 [Festuca glaucescens]